MLGLLQSTTNFLCQLQVITNNSFYFKWWHNSVSFAVLSVLNVNFYYYYYIIIIIIKVILYFLLTFTFRHLSDAFT